MRGEGVERVQLIEHPPPSSHAAAYGSVGTELHGKSGSLISLELYSAELLNKSVLHNVNVFRNTAHYSW